MLRPTDRGSAMDLPSDWFEQIRKEYPRRDGDQGWVAVRTLIPRAITYGSSWEEILNGTRAYKAYCERKGIAGTEYVKQAKTFYGASQAWLEDWTPPVVQSPQQLAVERRWDSLRARASAAGFREPHAVESPDVYETQLRAFERERPTAKPSAAAVIELARAKRL